jgi:hypothetical protein
VRLLATTYRETDVNKPKNKMYPFWLLFLFCLLIYLASSAISVVPNSPAEKVNNIICPGFLVLSIISCILAIWKTIAASRMK